MTMNHCEINVLVPLQPHVSSVQNAQLDLLKGKVFLYPSTHTLVKFHASCFLLMEKYALYHSTRVLSVQKNILANTYLTYQNGYSYAKLCTQIKFDNIPMRTYDSPQHTGCQVGRAGVFICASHPLSASRIWILFRNLSLHLSAVSFNTQSW